MRLIKKFLCVLLCVSISAIGSVAAFADEASKDNAEEAGAQAGIATEYYSDDLMKPLDEVTETVAGPGSQLDIAAKSAVLMESSTGNILYEQNPHEKLAPASITKIMSLLLIMEAFDLGKLQLNTVISTSDYAASMGGSQIWLEPGETMTADEMLKAVVVASANDATVAMAEAVAGSEESFVVLMNQRAAELGMNDTHFQNCTGLDAEGHVTSAYDVALMSNALIKHDLIKNYSTIWMDSLRGGQSELVNTNKLVKFYSGATGLKTGTTSTAGHCLSATAVRDNMELISVVMGSANSNDRFNGARKMLDYGFANWSRVSVEIPAEQLNPIPVKGGLESNLPVQVERSENLLVAKGRQNDVKQEIEMLEEIKAPVDKGQEVGKATLTLDGNVIGEIPILAGEAIGKMTYFAALGRLMKALLAL